MGVCLGLGLLGAAFVLYQLMTPQGYTMCWRRNGPLICNASEIDNAETSSTVRVLYPTGLPCRTDVSVYLDASTAVSRDEYAKEAAFLREKLAPKWVVLPSWTDVSLAAYGNDGAPWFGGFWYHEYDADKYKNDLLNISNIGPLGNPNVTKGLIAMSDLLDERRRAYHDVASILFTYTSDEDDLKAAQEYVESVTSIGDRLIVVGVGPNVDIGLLKQYLDVTVIPADNYDDDLANQIADAICEDGGVVPTLKPHPKLPCDVDVVLLMDRSVMLSYKNISDQAQFWRRELADRWTINPFETQIAFGDYSYGGISITRWGAYYFHYANNEAMEPIMSLFEHGPPAGSPKISYGLQSLVELYQKRRPNRPIVSLVFVYSSSESDVKRAKQSIPELTSGDDRLIVVGVGPKVDMQILSSLSGEAIHILEYDNAAGDLLNHAICNKLPSADFYASSNTDNVFDEQSDSINIQHDATMDVQDSWIKYALFMIILLLAVAYMLFCH